MSTQLTHANFDHFYLSDGMLSTLAGIGYKVPTPVQASTIPLVMAGIDLIVQSQTGTGKTAAFAIPITEMLSHNPGTIEVLVLAPTRELAKQVSEEFARFCDFKDVAVATIYGGTGYEAQHKALETAQVVVATPGRLLDLANRGHADLSKIRVFGLDEADEMLSMGFAEEVDAIIAKLPEERQSLLFSATITEDVKSLGKTMLYYPEFVTHSATNTMAADVSHEYYRVSGVGRSRDLLRVLEMEEPENAIIFANTRGDTFAVTKFLQRHGLRAEVLNGDLPQKERERTLRNMSDGKIDFLVATDVAARGIDISELSHVINYVIPDNAEIYVHRTGRTGRAGARGIALSLISPREMATLINIRKVYGVGLEERALPTAHDVLAAKRQRRLTTLDEALADANLPYGAALGLARELQGAKHVKLLARLIALADKVSNGGLDDVDLRATTPSAPVRAEADVEVSSEPEIEVEAAPAVEVEAEPAVEVEAEPAVKVEATPTAEVEAKTPDEASGEEKPTRRRRRRRRENGDSDESTEAKPPREKPAEVEAEEKPRQRSGRSRRGGRRRGKERREERREEEKPTTKPAAQPVVNDMSRIWVNVGKNHLEETEQVVEMVCFMAGMDPEDLGSITLENSYSYIEVRDDYFYDIITAMNNQDWNGITVSAEPARK